MKSFHVLFFILSILCSLNPISGFITYTSPGHCAVVTTLGSRDPICQSGMIPFLPLYTVVLHVKIVPDEDRVENVKCVSKEGVDIIIPSIEVSNSILQTSVVDTITRFSELYDTVLVVNPLGQAMRDICSQNTVDDLSISKFQELGGLLKAEIQRQVDSVSSGITIHWVRIKNINVPSEIAKKRLELATERAELVNVKERHLRITAEAKHSEELMKKKADVDFMLTEKQADIRRYNVSVDTELTRKIADTQLSIARASAELENEIIRKKGENEADNIKRLGQALDQSGHLTAYYDFRGKEVLAQGGQVVYYGDKLPSVVTGSFFNPTGN